MTSAASSPCSEMCDNQVNTTKILEEHARTLPLPSRYCASVQPTILQVKTHSILRGPVQKEELQTAEGSSKTASWTILWTVPRFSEIQYLNGDCIASQSVNSELLGGSWKIKLFPNGCGSNEDTDYVGLQFCFSPTESDFAAYIHITLLTKNTSSNVVQIQSKKRGEDIVTFSNFIERSVIHKDPDTYTPNGSLRIAVLIEVKSSCKSKNQFSSTFPKFVSEGLKKMFLEQINCDLKIEAEGKCVSMHSFMIDAFVPKFKDLLQDNIIKISDISFEIVEKFVYFLYTGCAVVENAATVGLLLKAATKFEVAPLKTLCYEYIAKNMNVDIFFYILQTTEDIETELMLSLKNFFIWNSKDIRRKEEWNNLQAANPNLCFSFYECVADHHHFLIHI